MITERIDRLLPFYTPFHLTSERHFESRWPTDGDRLFIEADYATDAPLAQNPDERLYRLPMGYKRAGDILLDQVATDNVDRRNIIYAAIYCYRHCVELYLKQLIEAFGAPLNNTHDLMALWNQFMVLAKELGADSSQGIEATRALVAEMDDADKRSDAFRFAKDKKGSSFAFADRGIDPANLRIVMQSLANFFECVHTSLQVHNEGGI